MTKNAKNPINKVTEAEIDRLAKYLLEHLPNEIGKGNLKMVCGALGHPNKPKLPYCWCDIRSRE